MVRPFRAFADIGSHWCDLVEFVTGDRLVAVCAELVTALPERIARGRTSTPSRPATAIPGRPRPVTTEDVALVLFRMAAGVTGSLVVSQISSGHKNQLRFEISPPMPRWRSTRNSPTRCGWGDGRPASC